MAVDAVPALETAIQYTYVHAGQVEERYKEGADSSDRRVEKKLATVRFERFYIIPMGNGGRISTPQSTAAVVL